MNKQCFVWGHVLCFQMDIDGACTVGTTKTLNICIVTMQFTQGTHMGHKVLQMQNI